jgi:hypothetical protein
MKKLFALVVVAGMAAMVACGPSAEELAAKEKAKQDSIAAAQKAIDDSIAAAQKLIDDSIAAKAKEDSIAAANAGKKPKGDGKKPPVGAGQGKG